MLSLLAAAGIPPARRRRAAAVLKSRTNESVPLGRWSCLQADARRTFWSQLQRAGVLRRCGALAAVHALQYALWIAGWWAIGGAALNGTLETSVVLAWLLLLVTLVPFSLLGTWYQGLVAVGVGALLKQRLLDGALRLEPDEVRHLGAGQLFSRVVESGVLETLALGGGFLSGFAVLELGAAAWVLS